MSMAQITYDDLPALRQKHAKDKIVFCSGGFDLTHAGHVLFFEDCKKHGDVLVVGVSSGAGRKKKGVGRPIQSQAVRLKMVDSLKPVDYVFINPDIPVSYNLEKIRYILEQLRPDIYVVNSDAPDLPYLQKISDEYGVKLIVLERWCPPEFEKISTTNLIEKIRIYLEQNAVQ